MKTFGLTLILMALAGVDVRAEEAGPRTKEPAAKADSKNDWPRFRGPTGDGLSPAKGIPTTWSKDYCSSHRECKWS